jgi:glutamate:Na+ symporter, ESS family
MFANGPIALPLLPSLLAACVVFLIGSLRAQRVRVLERYSIPGPIVGGLIFAVVALFAERTTGLTATFDTSARTPFLLLFFASIGLTADLALLRQGGLLLLRFVLSLFPFLVAQNALGLVLASLLGLHPVLGLVAGSITLVGGHGTGAAYAERFAEEHDILGLMGLTMTSATVGLILGGIIGGPVAERLIRMIGSPDSKASIEDGGVVGGPVSVPVTTLTFIASLAAVLTSALIGQAIAQVLEGAIITVPPFYGALSRV